MFVVSCGIPAADDAIPDRLLGLAVGGVFSVTAALTLWRDRPEIAIRRRLAQVVRPLAAAVDGLATDSPDVAARREEARSALTGTRTAALALLDRPTGAAPGDIAARRLSPGLAQLELELGAVTPPAGALANPERGYLRTVAEELGRAAQALDGDRSDPPSAERLEAARAGYQRAMRATLGALLADRAFDPASAVAFAVGRVGVTAAAVVGHVAVATEPQRLSSPKIVWNRVTANLGLDSVVLRNGLRLALALAAARAVAGAFDLSHGFWVVFATLSVTRGTARQTGATAWKAVQGTLLGAAIATPLILALESESELWLVLLPALTFLAVLAGEAGFVLGQAGFTLLIVGIFSLAAPAEWDVGLIRLVDVIVGATLGALIGLAAWPRGPASQLRRAIASAVEAVAAYEHAAASRLLGAEHDLATVARQAREATVRAEDVLIAYLGETDDRSGALTRWAPLVDGAWRRRYACEVVSQLPPADGHGCPGLVAAQTAELASLEARSRAAAEALANGEAPPPEPAGNRLAPQERACVAAAAEDGDDARREAVVVLLASGGWIGVVREELRRLVADVAAVARPQPGPAPPA